ncbi:signal peptidase I [Candidatus Woesearchaeota archaeon]|nr:signal peptidase I [Candidatus Woesearchaeota archaeon]
MALKKALRKTWHFIWEDNSILSWAVNVILAFILIKFIVLPGLGLGLGTTHPIVAVVSGSMEHKIAALPNDAQCAPRLCDRVFREARNVDFDEYWQVCGNFYLEKNISKEKFSAFPMKDGFNTGDLILLRGARPEEISAGDVIVFTGQRPDPIIHRVVQKEILDGKYYFTTKGDHNQVSSEDIGEIRIPADRIIGKSAMKVPFLGYIKIWFVDAIRGNLFAQGC